MLCAVKTAALTVQPHAAQEFVYEISGTETLIGRGTSTHLRVPDESISREHAVILLEDDGYTLEDLQSTNGTQVNGKRVRSARLADGDEILIGQTRMRFSLR
jgi:pSer/pThr/pTyr-binding forkhead associated (FHA) protein